MEIENEHEARIAQMRKVVEIIRKPREQWRPEDIKELDLVLKLSDLAAAHRGPDGDYTMELALEEAKLQNEIVAFAKEQGDWQISDEELVAGAKRLLNMKKPEQH